MAHIGTTWEGAVHRPLYIAVKRSSRTRALRGREPEENFGSAKMPARGKRKEEKGEKRISRTSKCPVDLRFPGMPAD